MKHTIPIKKILSLFLSLVMLLSITAGLDLSAYAATYSGSCGNKVTWSLDTATGELNITGTGTMTNYTYSDTAPWYSYRSSIKKANIGNDVTSIGEYAFDGCSSLTSITIPDSVTSIGEGALRNCDSLSSVTLGNSVTSMGEYAFQDCDSLTSVTIPNSVTSIGDGAFSNCETLTTVAIGDGVTSIGDGAFWFCDSLTSVTIPDSVTSIGEDVFYGCDSLTSITIPDSVTSIGNRAFDKCTRLKSIDVDSQNQSYASQDGVLFNKDKTELIQYPAGNTRTSYTIPDSVTSIGNDAFGFCDSLTSITIPDSVTSIGNRAFSFCDSLTSITIPDSVTSIGENAFYDCTSLTKTNYTGTIDEWCEISFANSTSNPIYYSNNLYINNNLVTEANLTTAKKINDYAFEDCDSLTSVTIRNGVTSIGDGAFWFCDSLTSVTIGNSVTSIGKDAFNWCKSLTDVYYNATIADWNSISIGDGNEKLTNATIHCTDGVINCKHIWNDGEITKSATCTELGETTYTCTACGETKTEPIEKAEHKYSTVVKTTAKVSREGELAEECAVCGDVRSTTPIAKIASLTLSTTTYTYNGKVKRPAVTVKDSNGEVIPSDYYTLTYSAGRKDVGKYQVTVKFKDRYTGTKYLYFRILPKATTISDIDAKKGGFIVKWNEVTPQTSGYQVQYSTSSKFTSPKTYKITNPTTTSKRVTGLKSGKKYYVHIRTYKTVDGQRYFSKWSKASAVITKK